MGSAVAVGVGSELAVGSTEGSTGALGSKLNPGDGLEMTRLGATLADGDGTTVTSMAGTVARPAAKLAIEVVTSAAVTSLPALGRCAKACGRLGR